MCVVDDMFVIVDIVLSDVVYGCVIVVVMVSGEVLFWRASASGDSNGTSRVERVGFVCVEGGVKVWCVVFVFLYDVLMFVVVCDDGVVWFYEF